MICPGGGHRQLVFNAEGVEPARYLNSIGVAAFALKYRLGREKDSPYKIQKHAREDGLRAMRLVRSRAAEWDIDPNRVGIMGFSAGGEVASMVAYSPAQGDPTPPTRSTASSSRPDFQILIYPGPLGIPDAIPKDAPPAFLLVANDDRGASRVDRQPASRSIATPGPRSRPTSSPAAATRSTWATGPSSKPSRTGRNAWPTG